MSSIFEQDSPLMRFLTRLADLVILNLAFVVTALPIVTIGAALTALNYTAMKLTKDECESVVISYWGSFRSNFRQATALWGIVFLLGVVLGAWFVVAEWALLPGFGRFILYGLLFVISLQFVLGAIYVFPYLAKFEGTIREVLRNSMKMAQRHPFSSVALLAVTVLPVVITIFYPALVVYGLVWFAIGFAVIAFVNAYVFSALFERYIPSEQAASA